MSEEEKAVIEECVSKLLRPFEGCDTIDEALEGQDYDYNEGPIEALEVLQKLDGLLKGESDVSV